MRFLVGLACGLLVATVAYIEWDATRPALQQVLDRLPEIAQQHVQLKEPAERSAIPEVVALAVPDDVVTPARSADRFADAIEAPVARLPAKNAEVAWPIPAVHTLPAAQTSTPDLSLPALEVPDPSVTIVTVPADTQAAPAATLSKPVAPMSEAPGSSGIAIVWEQFRSEVTARGFAGFVARSTGREFDVLPQALGRYAVVYRYSNEADLEAALAAVEQVAERGVAL